MCMQGVEPKRKFLVNLVAVAQDSVAIGAIAGMKRENPACDVGIMAGAHQRRKGFSPRWLVHGKGGVGADPSAAGKNEGGGERRILIVGTFIRLVRAIGSHGRRGRFIIDAGGGKRGGDAASSISASCKRAGAGAGETLIVDIAQHRHALDDRVDRRQFRFRPAALFHLAPQIGGQLCTSGCKPRDIG